MYYKVFKSHEYLHFLQFIRNISFLVGQRPPPLIIEKSLLMSLDPTDSGSN